MHAPLSGDLRWEACAPVHVADEIGLLGPDAHVCSRPFRRDTIAGGCGARAVERCDMRGLITVFYSRGNEQAK